MNMYQQYARIIKDLQDLQYNLTILGRYQEASLITTTLTHMLQATTIANTFDSSTFESTNVSLSK